MRKAWVYLIAAVAGLLFLAPLILMIVTSFKFPDEIRTGSLLALPSVWTFDSWKKAWASACIGMHCDGLQGYFANSLMITVPSVLISTLVGAINGYALSLWRFRGSELVFALILFGCFVPHQIVILPMATLLGKLGLTGGVSGVIFAHVVYGTAFTTLFFRNYYVSIPRDLVRAAVVDGAGFVSIFRKIILPLSPPIFVVTVIWQFTAIWNDFLFGAVFTSGDSQPITVALNNLVSTTTGVKEYPVDMAGAMITSIPTLLVYFFAGKYFVRGLTAGAVKG